MIRFVLMCAVAGLLSGCGNSNGGAKLNSPFSKKPAAAAKTPDQADYFEIRKDGKTYLLGSSDSRTAFMSGKTPTVKETKFDNGKSVLVENSDFNSYNRLVAEYKKAKGL